MNERQANRVQRLAIERRYRRCAAPRPIRGVTDQRMTDRRKMNTNLVRASGFKRALHERRASESLERYDVCARGLAACDDSHRRANARMAAYRRIDRCRACDIAVNCGHILAIHRARLQLAHEI